MAEAYKFPTYLKLPHIIYENVSRNGYLDSVLSQLLSGHEVERRPSRNQSTCSMARGSSVMYKVSDRQLETGSETHFLQSILPEIQKMTPEQQLKFRMKTLQTLADILYCADSSATNIFFATCKSPSESSSRSSVRCHSDIDRSSMLFSSNRPENDKKGSYYPFSMSDKHFELRRYKTEAGPIVCEPTISDSCVSNSSNDDRRSFSKLPFMKKIKRIFTFFLKTILPIFGM